MRNDVRYVRTDGRRRIKARKRSRSGILLFGFIILAALVVIASHIKNIYAQLADMQNTLKRIEVLQHGTDGYNGGSYEEMDYVSSIKIENVEIPLQRTSLEIMQKISELGQENPVINDIYNNYSLYPENLLAALANNPEMSGFVAGYPDGDDLCTLENGKYLIMKNRLGIALAFLDHEQVRIEQICEGKMDCINFAFPKEAEKLYAGMTSN